jgi:hypothetical protein
MNPEVHAALLATVAAALSALLSFFVTSWKVRRDLEVEYDKSLRTLRIESYKKLWTLLLSLARYPRPEPPSYENLEGLTEQLRDWYFKDGGLFLSDETREAYFDLQDALQALMYKNEDKSLFALDDVKAPTRLAVKMANAVKLEDAESKKKRWFKGSGTRPKLPLAEYLPRQFSNQVKLKLKEYKRFKIRSLFRRPAPSKALLRDVVEELNAQLKNDRLYREYSDELKHVPGQQLQVKALACAIRQLLDGAYSNEIEKSWTEKPNQDYPVARRFADLREKGSRLRTCMAKDVLTRRKPLVGKG